MSVGSLLAGMVRFVPSQRLSLAELCRNGPSIYDVHMEGVRLRWTHVDVESTSSKERPTIERRHKSADIRAPT